MEKLVTILEQFPLSARPYTAKDGTPMVFNSRGFLLSDGIDECYAEMTGDAALACPEYDRNTLHKVRPASRPAPTRTRTAPRATRTRWSS